MQPVVKENRHFIYTNSIITDGDEQNPLNFGSNVGHKISIIIFLEISKLYTKFLLLFTDATDPGFLHIIFG